MKVNKSGFDNKVKRMKALSKEGMPKIVEDAATYLNAKLIGSILNGQTGASYPKSYPGGVSSGANGFVGVDSGNLKRSISIRKIDNYTVNIQQIQAQLAPYHKYVAAWSTERYSMNFYEIAIKLYGPKVTKELFEFIERAVNDIDKGKSPTYSNPFPS